MAVDVTGVRLQAGRLGRGLVAAGRKAAAALAVVPLAARGRRAVLAELETLDPEVDDHRITQLVLGSMFSDEFFHQALLTVAYWRLAAVESIAPILTRRGLAAEPGPVDRLSSIRRTFPELSTDDARYLIAMLCFEPVRVPELLGVRGLTAKEQRALFLFWTRVGARWAVEIPEGQAEFRAWSHDHERRTYKRTQGAVDIALAMEKSFLDRWARGPLRPVGRQVLRAFSDRPLLDAVGMPAAHPAMRKVVARAVDAYLRGRRTVPGPRTDLLSAPLPEPIASPVAASPVAAVPVAAVPVAAVPVEVPVAEPAVEQADESRPAPSSRPSRRKVM